MMLCEEKPGMAVRPQGRAKQADVVATPVAVPPAGSRLVSGKTFRVRVLLDAAGLGIDSSDDERAWNNFLSGFAAGAGCILLLGLLALVCAMQLGAFGLSIEAEPGRQMARNEAGSTR
jgi:hypothetical protein